MRRVLLAGLPALALLTACRPSSRTPPADTPPPTDHSRPVAAAPGIFEDATERSRLDFTHQLADGKLDNIMESDGAGGVVFDFDGDGFMDLYLVNSGPDPVLSDAPAGTPRWPNRLFRNRGDGTFEDVTKRAGVEGHGFGTAAAAADYDNDGDTDLLVVNFGGLILYQNQGDGTFKDVTEAAGLRSHGAGISATFFDADGDGWLDIFVANYLRFDPKIKVEPGSQVPYPGPLAYEPEFNVLYRNRHDGTFEDVSEAAGIRVPGHRAMSVTAFDYDLDGHPDLYVCNDGTANLLLRNDGQGHFKDVGLQTGTALNQFGTADGSMGAAIADCDGDGLPDLFVTRFGKASLYINSRAGFFEDRIQSSGILAVSSPYTGWGGNFLDFDNDGDADIFIANGHAHFQQGMPPLLLENRGDGTFTDASAKAGSCFGQRLNARGSGAVDFDNDGRMDLVVTTLGDRARLWRDQTTWSTHWLTLKLVGSRSNRDGFGTQVKVAAGGRVWAAEARCPTTYVFQQDPRLHFGLGAARVVDRIELRWLSGQVQSLTNVAPDRILQVREP